MDRNTQTLPLDVPPEGAMVVQEAAALAAQPTPPDTSSPMGLMVYALQTGRTDALRELVELKRMVDADEAKRAFVRDFAAFQQEAPALKRIKDGLQTTSGKVVAKFAPLDYILATLRPILLKHGFTVRHKQEPHSETVSLVTCILTHREGHEESSSFLARPEGNDKLANNSQRMAGGVTTAKRITLKAVLGLEESNADQDFNNCATSDVFMDSDTVADIMETVAELKIGRDQFLAYLGADKPEHIMRSMEAKIRELFAKRRKKLLDDQASSEGATR